jgi:hypothetical protein
MTTDSPRFVCRSTALYIFARAVGRQRAMHMENSGFASSTLGRHISTFRGYQKNRYCGNVTTSIVITRFYKDFYVCRVATLYVEFDMKDCIKCCMIYLFWYRRSDKSSSSWSIHCYRLYMIYDTYDESLMHS